MNASPVIQAGSERPDRKKSRLELMLRLAAKPIPIPDGEQRVVEPVHVQAQTAAHGYLAG